jgi:hypothetical protein
LLTGANVGLNDVQVRVDRHAGSVQFTIAYWTWTRYAVGLGCALFLVGLLTFTVGRAFLPPAWFVDYDRYPWLAWSMLCFWGLAWPWMLVPFHKPHARNCLCRILDEVNAA